jgi:hypothetical protein
MDATRSRIFETSSWDAFHLVICVERHDLMAFAIACAPRSNMKKEMTRFMKEDVHVTLFTSSVSIF